MRKKPRIEPGHIAQYKENDEDYLVVQNLNYKLEI